MPARKPAPSAVVSSIAGRATSRPSTSAWNCMSHEFAAAPPSTRRRRIRTLASRSIAATTSATWNATASSVARTSMSAVVPRVMPSTAPRAPASHHGAPRPVNAGTTWTPPASGVLRAIASVSFAARTSPSPSRSHCTAAPAAKTLPSSA